jgi:hypothetical protein
MFRLFASLLLLLLVARPSLAQESIAATPSHLYVLMNSGQIERLTLGAQVVEPITTTDTFILDFGVDALGERIAYRTEGGLFVLTLADNTIRLIESEGSSLPAYRGRGSTMAWSPGGDAIAYTTLTGARVYFETAAAPSFVNLTEGVFLHLSWSPGGRFLAGEAEGNVWWIYRRDGSALTLTSVITSSIGIAWVSDAEIVFAPEAGGLRLMSLDQANAQAVLLDESVQYRLPTLAADDRLLFFGRGINDPALPDGFGRLLGLARGASSVETLGVVPIALANLRWVPGGSLLIAFQGGALALLEPTSGEVLTLPFNGAVAYDWGPLVITTAGLPGQPTAIPPTEVSAVDLTPETTAAVDVPTAAPTLDLPPEATESTAALPIQTVTGVEMSSEAFFVAPDDRGVAQVWWMPATGLPAARFTGAPAGVTEYTVTPDGRRVAYISNGGLWLQRFETSQPILLAEVSGLSSITPNINRDGTSVAYALENAASSPTPAGGIWVAPTDGGEPSRVLPNVTTGDTRLYARPQFSPDGRLLLVDAFLSNGSVVNAVFDLEAGTVVEAPPTNPEDISALTARWLADGRFLIYRDANRGSTMEAGFYIYSAAAPGASTSQWLPLPEGVTVLSVVEPTPGQLRAVLADAGGALSVVDIQFGQQALVRRLESLEAPRLSPDGQFVAGLSSTTTESGALAGTLVILELETGAGYSLGNPPTVSAFRWAQ